MPSHEAFSPHPRCQDSGWTPRTELKSSQQLLIKLVRELLSGGDTRAMLDKTAKQLVPDFGDMCLINLVDPAGRQSRLIEAHNLSHHKLLALETIRSKFPPNPNAPFGLGAVIRNGKSEVIHELSESMLRMVSENPEYLRLWLSIGIGSWIAAPIKVRGRIFGGIAVDCLEENRYYCKADLVFLEDLAGLLGLALERTMLLQEAEEMSQNKTAFLAHVSHEIRTPLAVIRGFSELLAGEAEGSAKNRHYWIENVLRSSQHLQGIVDDVLDISRIELGKFKMNIERFSLRAFLIELESMLESQAKDKSLNLVFTRDPQLPDFINSDSLRLKQILLNVIGNAIKFTDQGHVTSHVEYSDDPLSKETRHLIFTITDTGIGVSDEGMEKLFKPFSQADSSITRKFGGTGLGLYLSQNMARMLGGDLVLSASKLTQGSTFTLTIPSYESEATPATQANLKSDHWESNPKNLDRNLKDLRILIADDAPDLRKLLEHVLSSFGARVLSAKNGEEAVHLAQKQEVDCILMDLQMPILDGYAATQKLRAAGFNLPICALTAHAITDEKGRCLAAGFTDYLSKPVDMQRLKAMLLEWQQHSALTPNFSLAKPDLNL